MRHLAEQDKPPHSRTSARRSPYEWNMRYSVLTTSRQSCAVLCCLHFLLFLLFNCLLLYVQLQASAGALKVDVEEYRQFSLKCWAKFYRCCLEYEQLASQPLALFRDPRTGMGLILKQGVVSFLRPVHLIDCIDADITLQVEGKDHHIE